MVNFNGRGLMRLLTLFIKVLHCWLQLNYATGYYLTHPHANARDCSLILASVEESFGFSLYRHYLSLYQLS
ncbi:hypothetical protein VNO78_05944 [Psophocarpus tetragonolobus]|uniref:Secreted protein n=1 Tax=Psophocarpus tetragonolobus TaxID=3891 RepID=A0AAN9SUF7_PSOTE